MAKRKKTRTPEEQAKDDEFEDRFAREVFDNSDIVKEIREDVRDEFPDLAVKVRLSRRRRAPDAIIFTFEEQLPDEETHTKIKQMVREHQTLIYKVTKFYQQWEANFRPECKVKGDEETEEQTEPSEDTDD